MIPLPTSLFKIAQGLTFPKKSNILSLGKWSTWDWEASQSIVTELSTDTNIVILPSKSKDIDDYIQKFHNVTYCFHLLIHSYDSESLSQYLTDETISRVIVANDGSTCVLINKHVINSYLARKIIDKGNIDIDDPTFFLPDFREEKWSQEKSTVFFDAPELQINFTVPETFSLKRTSPDLLWAIECVLLSPWHEVYRNIWVPTRRHGNIPGISFSGGVDSTAAMALMPNESILFYMERDFESMINHSNAKRFISHLKELERDVIISLSNHEKVRTFHEKNPGFSTDYACMAHMILLADHYDLDSAATGMPLENSYFFHGSKIRDFKQSGFWNKYNSMFSFLGIPLYQPVAGCSEVLNNKIVIESGYKEYATSCLRSPMPGKTCEKCWKCFRKNLFNGMPWEMSPEISKFLSKRPLKQGIATLYALQLLHKRKLELPDEVTDLSPLLNENLDFLLQYWEPSLHLIPEKYKSVTKNKLEKFASPMSIDLYSIKPEIGAILRGEQG